MLSSNPGSDEPVQGNSLKTCVSISRRINLGNYESADVMLSISGIEATTTAEQIQAALAAGALGYDALKLALAEKVKDQRQRSEADAMPPSTAPPFNGNSQAAPPAKTNGHGTASGATPEPALRTASMSANQRAKLIELYRERFGGTEAEALEGLEAVFDSAFKHGLGTATLAEASKIISQMIGQKAAARTPAPTTPSQPATARAVTPAPPRSTAPAATDASGRPPSPAAPTPPTPPATPPSPKAQQSAMDAIFPRRTVAGPGGSR